MNRSTDSFQTQAITWENIARKKTECLTEFFQKYNIHYNPAFDGGDYVEENLNKVVALIEKQKEENEKFKSDISNLAEKNCCILGGYPLDDIERVLKCNNEKIEKQKEENAKLKEEIADLKASDIFSASHPRARTVKKLKEEIADLKASVDWMKDQIETDSKLLMDISATLFGEIKGVRKDDREEDLMIGSILDAVKKLKEENEKLKEDIIKLKADHERDYVYPKIIANAHNETKKALTIAVDYNTELQEEIAKLKAHKEILLLETTYGYKEDIHTSELVGIAKEQLSAEVFEEWKDWYGVNDEGENEE